MRSTALATSSAVAGRALAGSRGRGGRGRSSDGDLERARALLPSLVGRDPSGLGAGEIARAVVESVAENTVDAVVAPAFWGAVAGAPGALGYRAVNTLDSMVGHRSPRYANYGWASARLDDALAWVPARLTAALVAVVRPPVGAGRVGARCATRPRRIRRRTRAWRRPRSPPRSACGSGGRTATATASRCGRGPRHRAGPPASTTSVRRCGSRATSRAALAGGLWR